LAAELTAMDLTEAAERRQAEEQAKLSQIYISYLTKYANDLIILLDDNFRFLETNERVADFYGYTREELLGMHATQLRAAETRALFDEQTRLAGLTDRVVYETVHRRKDGTRFPVEISLRAVDIDGKRFYHAVIRDITERKQAEDKLRRSEEKYELERRYHAILDQTFEHISLLTPDGTVIESNRSVLNVLGARESDLAGKPFWEMPCWTDSKEMQDRARDAVYAAARGEVARFEAMGPPAPGQDVCCVDWSIKPVTDERGEVFLLVAEGRDVTEKAQAAEKLRMSEYRYRTLYESSHDAIMILTPEQGFVAGNPATLAMFECKDEREFAGLSPADLSPEYQLDGALSSVKAQEMMAIAMREGSHFFEWTHKRLGGAAFPATVLLTKMNLRDEVLLQATVRDISKEKLSEEGMREFEARFRDIIDNSREGVIFVNTDAMTIFSGNLAMAALLGRSQEELSGMPLSEIHPADSFADVAREFEQHWAGNRHFSSDIPVIRKDGDRIYVDITSTVVTLNGVAYLAGFIRDVTDRKRAEEALRQSEKRLRDIIDGLGPDMFVGLLKPDGILLETNRPSLEVAGLKLDDLLGQPFEEGYWWSYSEESKQRLRATIEQAARGEPSRYDVQIRVAEDQFIFIDFSLQPLRDETGKIVFLVPSAASINERKQAEEQVRRLNIELEQRVLDRTAQLAAKNEELKGFAYTVSHDLKAPLRGIAGYADELDRKHRAGLSERAQFCINQILTAARHQDLLIEDLLHYSRLDTETLAVAEVSLSGLVEAILKDRSLVIAEQHVEVTVDIPFATLPTWERGLVHVLTNLIDNALKYSRKANPPRLGIRAEELSHVWRLAVSDNGIGFDMKYHDRIFGLFNRLVREEEFEGTGAGLAIVKKVLDKQGGRVWAESALGQGATFFVELPKAVEQNENRSEPAT
jgi:PAS domain S-box-containing protein